MKTLEEIKTICREVVEHHAKFKNDTNEPRIALALLLQIERLQSKAVTSCEGVGELQEIRSLFPR